MTLLKTAAKLVRKGKATPPEGSGITENRKDPVVNRIGSPSDVERELTLAEKVVPRNDRPTHRVSSLPIPLPFVGKKVDTIEWCREEIALCTAELDKGRAELSDPASWKGDFPPLNSVFVLFHQQIAAHLCAQSIIHHIPYAMAQHYTEVAPEDVIWSNLSMNPYEAKIRMVISWAITAAIFIFWVIPGMSIPCSLPNSSDRGLFCYVYVMQLPSLVLSQMSLVFVRVSVGCGGSASCHQSFRVSFLEFCHLPCLLSFSPYCPSSFASFRASRARRGILVWS